MEDSKLIAAVEKWSKSDDDYAEMATDLCLKWKKCMRKIPHKAPKDNDEKLVEDSPEDLSKPPPLQQMAPKRRSPRSRSEREDIDPEVRAQLKKEHRRKFEQEIEFENEQKNQAKINIDDRIRQMLEEEDSPHSGKFHLDFNKVKVF